MKKFIIAASLLAVALTSNAQDTYKFAAGDNNFEFSSAPFSGSPLGLPQIKYRRFLSESLAFRLGLNVTMTSKSSITPDESNLAGAPAGAMIDLTRKESSFGWELAPGIEKHFAGTDRLSPYVGAELRVAGKSSTVTDETQAADGKINTTTTKNDNKGGFMAFGLNLVAGADFYFAKKVYLGGEFGYGFGFTSYSDRTVENTALTTQPDPMKQGSEFGFGASLGSLNGRLKLGFLF